MKKRIINIGDIQLIGAVGEWGLVLTAVAGAVGQWDVLLPLNPSSQSKFSRALRNSSSCIGLLMYSSMPAARHFSLSPSRA